MGFNIGALIITCTVLRVPYYNYSIIHTKTLLQQAPDLCPQQWFHIGRMSSKASACKRCRSESVLLDSLLMLCFLAFAVTAVAQLLSELDEPWPLREQALGDAGTYGELKADGVAAMLDCRAWASDDESQL